MDTQKPPEGPSLADRQAAFAAAPAILDQLKAAGVKYPHFHLFGDASGRLTLAPQVELTPAQLELACKLVGSDFVKAVDGQLGVHFRPLAPSPPSVTQKPACRDVYQTVLNRLYAWWERQYQYDLEDKFLLSMGFAMGHAEKIYLGACRAAMFCPPDRYGESFGTVMDMIAEGYGLTALRIDEEYWLCRDAAVVAMVNIIPYLQKNSAAYHAYRGLLLGVPDTEIDLTYHTRYQDQPAPVAPVCAHLRLYLAAEFRRETTAEEQAKVLDYQMVCQDCQARFTPDQPGDLPLSPFVKFPPEDAELLKTE